MDQERHGLEAFLRISRWLLLLVGLLPFDFDGARALWPWEGLLDAGLFDGLALLLPWLGLGLVMLLLRWRPPKLALSLAMLGALGLGVLAAAWGEQAPYPLPVYEHLTDGLPPLFSRALWLLVLGQALLAAGLRLGARGHLEPMEGRPELSDPWPAARVLTGLGMAAVLAFYLLPYRGSLPLLDLFAGMGVLLGQLDDMPALALLAGHVLSLGPLAFAAAAGWRLFVPARGRGGALSGFLIAYLPGLCLVVGLRNLPFLPAYTLIHLRAAALLVVATGGLALALAALIRAAWYEIPWLFGRLTRFDDVLAAELALPGGDARLAKRMGLLCGLLRPWLRRRLALWRSAAGNLEGVESADLSRVMLLLERRWREEQAVPDEQEPQAAGGPISWPAWARRPWLGVLLLLSAGLLAALSWGLSLREDAGKDWPLGETPPGLRELLAVQLPTVVLDISNNPRLALERLPAYRVLDEELKRAEETVPGIRDAVLDLLSLGRHGRRRIHRIRRARDRLNHLLRRHAIPVFISSRVRPDGQGADMFYLLVYRIRVGRRYQVQGGERRFSVLELSRLDRLNVVEAYLGMTEQEESAVTVLADRLREVLAVRLRNLMDQEGVLAAQARSAWRSAFQGRDAPAVDAAEGLAYLREGLTRHELHHRWMGLEPEPSTLLWSRLEGFSEDAVRGVTAEVGAYLGELRFGAPYARLRLSLMLDSSARPMGAAGLHGRARSFLLQQLLLPELAEEFRPRVHGGAAAARLAGLGDLELMERVDDLHRQVFGQAAPVFTSLPAGP